MKLANVQNIYDFEKENDPALWLNKYMYTYEHYSQSNLLVYISYLR